MFFFRADASNEIGTGHIMRCLAIADVLLSRGHKVGFICAQINPQLKDLIRSRQIPLFQTQPDPKTGQGSYRHSHWLIGSEEADAELTIKAIGNVNCEGVFMDHYGLAKPWEDLILKKTSNVAVMDDLCDRPHSARILIDYNIYKNEKDYSALVDKSTQILQGPAYAPIRMELRDLRENVQSHSGQVRSVLISFGGSDSQGYTLRAAEGLVLSRKKFEKVRIILSPESKTHSAISKICHENAYELLNPTPKLGEYILKSDFGIGAGGVTQVERSFLGLPSLIASIAENQSVLSAKMSEIEICKSLGDAAHITSGDWSKAIQKYSSDQKWLKETQEKGLSLFDGKGCDRIVNALNFQQ